MHNDWLESSRALIIQPHAALTRMMRLIIVFLDDYDELTMNSRAWRMTSINAAAAVLILCAAVCAFMLQRPVRYSIRNLFSDDEFAQYLLKYIYVPGDVPSFDRWYNKCLQYKQWQVVFRVRSIYFTLIRHMLFLPRCLLSILSVI